MCLQQTDQGFLNFSVATGPDRIGEIKGPKVFWSNRTKGKAKRSVLVK